MAEEWLKTWICLSCLFAWTTRAARPRFDVSTDMGMVLVPADAEVDTAIFRLRATDQDADFPLVFEIIATTSPIVRVENLPCTLYNKVCQANVILTRRLVPGRLHDFVVRVRDSKGDVNSMQATISVTNSTTPRDKIFPHLPSLIMVPEDTKPEKELDYLLVESNPWSGKPVYIELWQPKELFKIRQRQMGSQTKGIITLIGELDFETQSMYTLTMYATDPYTEPGKDTRNIAGVNVVVVVQDVQDVPPIFTLAPPLTKINNTVKPGDVILRVHAEDGDKGVPREVTYGLISEGNPFTPFFNVSETTGEIILARPLEELTKITHVGAPIVLKIVAEEIRTTRDEPPAQATVVELGLLLGEPGNSPPYFENDNYMAWIDENAEPGTIIIFSDAYSTRVKDEDIGKAGVFALKLENNNGTFEISPAVAERNANFVITVRDNSMIDYEKFKSLRFKIVAQEVGPATNLSTSVPVTIFLRDVNDNPPTFDVPVYEVTLSENASAGTRVVQVHATDNDAGAFGRIQYTKIIGDGSAAFEMNPDSGIITVSMGSILDREQTAKLELTVEARDEDGRGMRGIAALTVNILDVNDNAPVFDKAIYEFLLNSELTNFTMPAIIKAVDTDAEPPNNVVRYEIVHGNYENKFQLNEETGELMLREPINKARKARHSNIVGNVTLNNMRKQFRVSDAETPNNQTANTTETPTSASNSTFRDFHLLNNLTEADLDLMNQDRRRRAEDSPLFILTARAYDLGVPHLSNVAQIRIMRPSSAFARIVMFVMPGENPDPKKTAETLATITGSKVVIQEIKPYFSQIDPGTDSGKRSVVVARVENGPGTLVDVDKIRASLEANGFGIISGMDTEGLDSPAIHEQPHDSNSGKTTSRNVSVIGSNSEEVTVYRAENKLLTWLLVLLGLLLLAAIITLIVCCICPSCPFYMEPRKRRIHSSETLVIRSDGRPKRHIHRKPIKVIDGYSLERKEAWSADPARQNWQFNRRNTKNLGIASLPGDVLPGHQHPDIERMNRGAASLRNVPVDPAVFGEHVIHQTRVIPMPAVGGGVEDEQRIYMEDVEAQQRSYEQAELDSLRRHELERGSDGVLRNEAMAAAAARQVREQHFYRDGNAEVLRLVTRGEIEDHDRGQKELYHANGKDILLQRFIEDQKLRRSQDLRDSFHESLHEADVDRSMESHQRAMNETTEILILPERLELQRQPSCNPRQHQQEQMLTADVQRLIVERNYNLKNEAAEEYRGGLRAAMRDAETLATVAGDPESNATYAMHDAELVKQNALLTRLLLEKEARGLNVPVVDSSSFLETQSLPGQVAIATQTDRTAATQTEFIARSRSDNEESEEDPRLQRKSKLKAGSNRLETKEDFKKMKTIWVRTPIPEESRAQSGSKKATPTRTKIEVLESHKVSISPDVLKEISNSLKSGDSDTGNEDDEDEEAPLAQPPQAQAIPDKSSKVATKTACTSKKKVKESRVDDTSTTPSPDTKEKKPLLKGKIRKKIEKPPRKKLQKSIEAEKSHFMEPSFRVLEREISSFQQKIRQFGDKKLKMLKKDDSGKKDKESEDDEAAGYKKCEVTVTRTKKSVSRETSPHKISVEQKTKASEEESCTKVEKVTRPQQHTSSSDLEDFDKSKVQSTNHKEKMTRYETSKMQTRSRSQLRRQTHLENSDTKSGTEKTEKSEDSESKTENTKETSSSAETKTDSSSSREIGKTQKQAEDEKVRRPQTQEKKCMQSQKITTRVRPSGTVDIKRKITSMRSKTVEEPIKRPLKREEKAVKSMTSDESRLTSPTKSKESVYHKKSGTSEEDKSNGDCKSSMSKDSMAIDLDKFVKDVRGVVEKEISSFTQAAKDALKINKPESSADDKKQESKNTSRQSDTHKTSMETKEKSQSVDAAKRRSDTKSTEKERMFKSMESKDKRERLKSQREKSKSIESAMEKSDDAISFIVVSDHGKKHEDPMKKNSKSREDVVTSASDASSSDPSTKNVANKVSQKIDNTIKSVTEKIDNAKDALSDKMEETKQKIADAIHEDTKAVSDNVEKAEQTVSSKVDETKNIVTNEISKVQQIESSFINKTNEAVVNTIDETKQAVSDHIDETHKIVSNQIDETNKTTSEEINDTKKVVSDQIDKTKRSITDRIDETKKNVKDTIDETKKMVAEKIDETKKSISDKIERSISKSDEDGQTIDAEKRVSAEKKEGTSISSVDRTLETSKYLATNLVDTTADASNKAALAAQEKAEEVENALSNTDLLKSVSTSLPDEMKEEDEKNASKTLGAISENQMKEMKDAQSAEPNKKQISEEATSSSNIAEIKDMTKELLDMEKMEASKQSTSKTESITTLSSSLQEKETTSETTQMKQAKEPEQTPPEAPLNKEDSASSNNANKGEEAAAVAESSTAMTQFKQMEAAALHPTDKKDSASANGNSDKTPETTTSQVSPEKQQGQTAAPKIAPADLENRDEVVPGEKSESEKPKSPIKVPKKPILTITTTENTAEEETEDDDDDTSSVSDISSKTALRMQPYGTPRHSISSDGEDHVAGKTLLGDKSDGKPRQKWSTSQRDPLLKVEASQQQSREAASKAVFPQKIEVTPIDKPKSSGSKASPEQTKAPKSSVKESHGGVGHAEAKAPETSDSKQRADPVRTRPVIVAVKKKEHLRTDHFSRHTETRKTSPRREKSESIPRPQPTDDDNRTKSSTSTTTTTSTSIRSRHLKLHVSHSHHQPKPGAVEVSSRNHSPMRGEKDDHQGASPKIIDHGKDPEIANARSRYMAWYQQKRAEMEKKRREKKEAEEEQQRPKWLKKPIGGKSRKAKSAEDAKADDEAKGSRSRERAKSSSEAAAAAQSTTPRGGLRVSRLRIRPLVNVESEQLKAIVRQGRKLRRAEGVAREEDPPVQIFAPEKPVQVEAEDTLAQTMQLEPRHHLIQHSEYKYEKTMMQPMPFYLHPPPPVPHPSPEHFQDDSSDSRRLDDDLDSGIAVSLQSGAGNTRLRHQQLLEKKSVFDIAYSEAAPTQLRSDSSTPPS
ncbi:hypothetical protein TSAR_007837 [Trichomalopsis sarcophagae]|uniref:Cadherin domain-containing protein n=1 Tax=Trichomalopsis sarcophagae TaxID=543379 RepID=A0A232FNI5_9HYME|nr:hypothetical protein TSAR_007837 [Trichomalopsis sarcophagae]